MSFVLKCAEKMKKLLLFSSFLVFNVPSLFSQNTEIGILIGASTYSGDLNPTFINLDFIHPAASFLYRYNTSPHYALKTTVLYGAISADDAMASNSFQVNRNLSFESTLTEISQQLEFNFLPLRIDKPKSLKCSPYVFTGISVFMFNPKTLYNGDWIELQPLGTEGQGTADYFGKKYSLFQLSVPLGGGIKLKSSRINLGLEIGARKTLTDYLDDVSTRYADKNVLTEKYGAISAILSDRSLSTSQTAMQRGNSTDTDWYTFGGLWFSITLGKDKACHNFKL